MLKSIKHFFHAPIISNLIYQTYQEETGDSYQSVELCFQCPACGYTWVEVMNGKPINKKESELDSQ